jgi:signal peptidase I
MKKAIILFVTGGLMFTGWVVCRLTHVLDIYKISSASNMPTYKYGDVLLVSRLKKAERNTFICYKKKQDQYGYISRCVAVGGDVIEMKSAVLYLNDKKINEPFTWNQYQISPDQLHSIEGYIKTNNFYVEPTSDSLSMIMMGAADLKKYHLNLKQVISAKGTRDTILFKFPGDAPYNVDNFGPVKVPADSYFLLGDNRHDAFDSRFKGFIKKDEIIGAVVGKIY